MARRGITKEMVTSAIEQIKEQGGDPTTKSIRDILGTGSLSTISRYLNNYQTGNQNENDFSFDIKDALSAISDEAIGEFLSNEHPQISAVILSQLGPEPTAKILGNYKTEKANDIIDRIEKLGPVQQRIMCSIDKVIREEVKAFVTTTEMIAGGAKFAAQVRNALKGQK